MNWWAKVALLATALELGCGSPVRDLGAETLGQAGTGGTPHGGSAGAAGVGDAAGANGGSAGSSGSSLGTDGGAAGARGGALGADGGTVGSDGGAAGTDGGAAGTDDPASVGCGNGTVEPGEECDQGTANSSKAYGPDLCTDKCKQAPYCGDGVRNGTEACDAQASDVTDLGACDPECSGFYEKKFVKATYDSYSTNLGGIVGADAKCVAEFGSGWKALLVGSTRRATVTPFAGDQQLDWVIRKYRHYYNSNNQLLWRTDNSTLLGVRDGKRANLYADAFPDKVGTYPWSGYDADYTTFDDSKSSTTYKGTCNSWTAGSPNAGWGSFVQQDLASPASEQCGASGPLLCVEQ
ncbi:MAG: DUF1554 domain-containing protein [Polyangiaceae bacterium]